MKKHSTPTFKTPEDYFDSFYKRLADRIKREDANVVHCPIPQSEGFVVPKGYFEGIAKKVQARYSQGAKHVALKAYKNVYYYAAAVAALFLLIFGILWKTQPAPTFETLADSEIQAFFENDMPEMDAYKIAEVLPVSTIALNNALDTDITNEALWHYLIDTVEDIEPPNTAYDAYP